MSREGIERTLREHWGVRVALVVALAAGVLIGTLVSNGVRAARDNPGALAEPLPVPSAVELSSVFSKVAKEVEPAVVNISSETIIEPRARRSRPGSPEEFFERFFDFGVPFEFGPRTPQRQRSLGSGVLVDPSGYILTNYHVIHEADKIKVRLHGDSKEYPAEVIGFDEETDLAVIKISVDRKLPVAQLGDSDGTQVGDWVLAIGSPFGLDATVTAGIISYKGREVTGGTQFQRFLQTDAAINHGNSGGPLVNLVGQVIGINTMIATDRSRMEAGNVGIGFALPSNIARGVYNQIRRQGRVVRGSIGISFRRAETENEVILRSFGADSGVLVDEVQPGGPADRAGLQRGDVITAVNGETVRSGDELVEIVTATAVGEGVTVRYLRDKKEREVTVSVEDRCKVFPEQCRESRAAVETERERGRLGIRVEQPSASQLRNWGLDPDEDRGVLVREVDPNGFAEEVGLERGDLILEINQQRVRTLREFNETERRLGSGSDVVFGIKRPAQARWLWIYLGGTLP